MNAGEAASVTLTDMLAEMGVPGDALSKSTVGRFIAKAWREQTGLDTSQPYGQKANGAGSHNLTAYPPSFKPEMRRLIEEALTLSRSEIKARAPLPRDVEAALASGSVRDATPPASGFWWQEEAKGSLP